MFTVPKLSGYDVEVGRNMGGANACFCRGSAVLAAGGASSALPGAGSCCMRKWA